MKSKEQALRLLEPMSDEEIRELLGATLHGALPHETMMRVLATLAIVPELRRHPDVQERDRAARMTQRVHQLEAQNTALQRDVTRMQTLLGKKVLIVVKDEEIQFGPFERVLSDEFKVSEDAAAAALAEVGRTRPRVLRKRARKKR